MFACFIVPKKIVDKSSCEFHDVAIPLGYSPSEMGNNDRRLCRNGLLHVFETLDEAENAIKFFMESSEWLRKNFYSRIVDIRFNEAKNDD